MSLLNILLKLNRNGEGEIERKREKYEGKHKIKKKIFRPGSNPGPFGPHLTCNATEPPQLCCGIAYKM